VTSPATLAVLYICVFSVPAIIFVVGVFLFATHKGGVKGHRRIEDADLFTHRIYRPAKPVGRATVAIMAKAEPDPLHTAETRKADR